MNQVLNWKKIYEITIEQFHICSVVYKDTQLFFSNTVSSPEQHEHPPIISDPPRILQRPLGAVETAFENYALTDCNKGN